MRGCRGPLLEVTLYNGASTCWLCQLRMVTISRLSSAERYWYLMVNLVHEVLWQWELMLGGGGGGGLIYVKSP
jgi:hypothetical protein